MLKVEYELTNLNELIIRDGSEADIVTWQGHPCLRFNGLAVVPDLQLSEGSIEVDIGADGTSYRHRPAAYGILRLRAYRTTACRLLRAIALLVNVRGRGFCHAIPA